MKNTPLHAVLTRFGIIAAVLATLMLIVPGTAAQTVPVNPTTVNYLEGGEGPVARYQAAVPGGKPFSWEIDPATAGVDAADFKIGAKTGLLEFASVPNFESPADADTNNVYSVQVVAKLDDAPAAAPLLQIAVTVNVLNKDEVPEIQLTTRQPENGVSLGIDDVANDQDEDSGDDTTGNATYQWATSPDGTTGWTNVPAATGPTYTPVSGDVGKYLRVTLTYGDTVTGIAGDAATKKSIIARSDTSVQDSSITNAAPAFDDTDSVAAGVQQTRNLAENSKAGEAVGAPVTADDDRGLLTYSITGGADQTAFEIDRASGQLTVGTGTTPDAEDANGKGDDQFEVIVTATDGAGATGTVTVTIDVDDLNEAPTVTAPGSPTIDFNEDATKLTIGTYTGADEDMVGTPPANETFEWSVSDPAVFTITPVVGTPTQAELAVKAGVLDYETATMHEVDVIATDDRGMAGKQSVTITVNNVDEAGTVTFTTQQPQVGVQLTAILEDPDGPVSGNTSLTPTWVWARGDSGTCATASYKAIDDDNDGNNDATDASYTPVDADATFCLQATATYDDGQSSTSLAGNSRKLPGHTANAVLARRQANYAPEFKDAQGLVITSAVREVKEDAGAGADVGDAVTSSDRDANDKPTHSLGGADEDSFTITPDGGQIQVAKGADLDFETKTSYSVTVTATDGNTASTSIPVTINITDVNEAPTVSGPATAEVAEYTEQKGMTVVVGSYTATDVDAADQDANRNTVVAEWKVSGTDNDDFEISDDGVLSFGEGKPDFDSPSSSTTENEYMVTVVAVDSGGNEGTTDVTVTVTNEEELGSVSFNIEQPGVGIEVTATAMDDDSADDTSTATWQWSSSDSEDGEYSEITGATKAAFTPSADEADMWLRATATYNGKSVSNEMSYAVKAYTAVNALPVFPDQDPNMSGEQTDQMRDVAENSKAGTNVGAPVEAHDSDDIDVLTYTLAETDGDSASFDIDQASGQISVKSGAMLDHETKDTYEVRVTATDGSGAPASVKVTINVTDANDDPVINTTTSATAATYDETGSKGFTVTAPVGGSVTYTATDQDTFDAEVRWALEGADASAFEFTSVSTAAGVSSATLAFKSNPDFEAKETYKVTVVANDYDDVGSRDTVGVTVTVTNDNEAGVITVSTLEPQVDVPFIATLSDPDGIGGYVTWLTSGAGATGIVSNNSTSASITYTPKATGALTITASYDDKQAGTGKAQSADSGTNYSGLTVRAKQSSNRPPAFDDQDTTTPGTQNDQATRTVPENSVAGIAVGTAITATDPDTSATAVPPRTDVLTYALSDYVDGSGDAAPFRLTAGSAATQGQSSGQITVAANAGLDFESGKTEYVVKLTVTDGSGATDTIKVIITVTDEAEAPVLVPDPLDPVAPPVNVAPAFADDAATTIMVDENAAAGAIGDAYTADDPGDVVTYSVSGSIYIEVDDSGQLSTTMALDYESAASHMVTITAMDDEGLSDTIDVTINVGDMYPGCTVAGNNGLTNDCEALLMSKAALEGGSGASLNWDENTPISSEWDGIQTHAEYPSLSGDPMRVTALHLQRHDLDGTIPASFGMLSELRALWIWGNDLTGDLSALDGLTKLERVYANNNELDRIGDLSGATSLAVLWVHRNEDHNDDDVGGGLNGSALPMADTLPTSLKWLSLYDNAHTGSIPDLSSLTSLERLYLHANNLSDSVPASLGSIASLDVLHLRYNDLSGSIPSELGGLTNLRWLTLDNNRLSGSIPTELGGMSSLLRLYLSNNSLSGQIPAELGSLSTLTHLLLRNNQLTGDIPEELDNLTNLVWVRIAGNSGLTGCVPAGLVDSDTVDSDAEELTLQTCGTGQ